MTDALRIEGLSVSYYERHRTVRAVDGVTLHLREGTTLAIVGESGCGKTTLALSVLDLVPAPGRINAGEVMFGGRNLLSLPPAELRAIRGNEISMIFQDAISGLNPVLSIGTQVEEIIRAHQRVSRKDARAAAIEALRRQHIPRPESIIDAYPFQLSGGMCQRVMIAIATVLQPGIIIADEPTSALDVTVQAAILRELDDLKRTLGASILLITHDLGVVARMADDVAVMYAGRIVEHGAAEDVFARPLHPYTAALLAARPRPDGDRQPLQAIRGAPPDLSDLSAECAFLPRCTKAVSACRSEPWPALAESEPGHTVGCFNPVFHVAEDQPAVRA